ncbi:MAG: sugar transferase [Anaerolineae bacterium]|nr:sugar transferase [Anaerolineae bacterium]
MNSNRSTNHKVHWRMRSGERWLILMIGDLIMSGLALVVSIYIWMKQDWLTLNWVDFARERIPVWFYFLPIIWIMLLVELYDARKAGRRSENLKGIGIASAISLVVYLLVFFFADPFSLPRLGVLAFIIAAALFTLTWRLIYIQVFTAPLFMRRVFIIGAGRAGSQMAKLAKEIWPPPFHLIGLIDDDPEKLGTRVEDFPVMGGCNELMDLIEREKISDLIFAISGQMTPEMLREVMKAAELGVSITTMPIIYEEIMGRVPIALLQSDWLLRYLVDQIRVEGFYEVAKRLMDIFGALVGLLILLVAFPFISIAIILDTGFPVFYSQARAGKNGHTYRMFKFRTMFTDAEKDGSPKVTVENDNRITRFGWFLRKTHLDELPQFLNVLIGDMSLVGPRAERPELMDGLQAVVPFYRARLMVRPGLTGWAQVNFGYASNAEATAIKTEYDLYYIKHRNLLLDITILFRTVGTVIGFRGQ